MTAPLPHALTIPSETGAFFSSADLTRLWAAARTRLERNGVQTVGHLILDNLTDAERHALSGILGLALTSPRARVDLALLDRQLRASPAQRGLAAVLETIGPPLVDRRARRAEAEAAHEALWTAARAATVTHGLAASPWCEIWLTSLRCSGILARLNPQTAARTVRHAARCLSLLPGLEATPSPRRAIARNDLAVELTRRPHALDDGSTLAAAVLRGIAAALGADAPVTAAARRSLWHEAGVMTDQVSTTVLTLGLRPLGGGARNAELRGRADDAVESHLTARDLRRIAWELEPNTVVHICENPRILEAAADASVRTPVVCSFGNPTSVFGDLLDTLASAGASFRYHGDFDWPGIAIANRVITRVGAAPWRMTIADYDAAIHCDGDTAELDRLEGRPVAAIWDAGLEAAMRRAGWAASEELVLDLLVADLIARGSEASSLDQ